MSATVRKGVFAMIGRSLVGALGLAFLAGSASYAADGAAVYTEQCAKCHGAEGKSDTPVAEKMKIPPIAGDAALAALAESEIAAKIKAVKKHPPKAAKMSDDELNAVAAHVKKLAGGN